MPPRASAWSAVALSRAAAPPVRAGAWAPPAATLGADDDAAALRRDLILERARTRALQLELDRARRGAVASPEPTAAALGLDAAVAVTPSAKRPGDALDGAPEPKKAQAAAD